MVRVRSASRKGPLVEVALDGELTIYVQERAVDGKANAAVVKLLAKHVGARPSRVELMSGATSRLKRFEGEYLVPSVRKVAVYVGVSAANTHARGKES